MSNLDVKEFMSDIQSKVKKDTIENENLIDFLASELSHFKIENEDEVLNKIMDNIDTNYFTKNELQTNLHNKIIENQSNSDITSPLINKKSVDFTFNLLGLSKENESISNFKPLLSRMEQNFDLSNLSFSGFHFSKTHLSLISRIFHKPITQNYLSALKWIMINDLVEKQTKFNLATEDSIKNILNLVSETVKKTTVDTNELKNYQHESEKWIQSIKDIPTCYC